jgi:uncharacterized protein (DUF302 family)
LLDQSQHAAAQSDPETIMNPFLAVLTGLALAGGQVGLAAADTPTADPRGLVVIESTYDVPTTAERFAAAAEAKGLTIFARVDHAAGAAQAGMSLPPTQLIIFGNAKVGTPLMQCDRSVGIDLPLKAMIWRDDDGKTLLAYNAPSWLAGRHDLDDCTPVLGKIDKALNALALEATAPAAE